MTHDEIIDECLGHAVGMFERQRLIRICRMAVWESKTHARYEFVRTLTPHAFTFLWQRCLRGGKFDAMVDELILERAKAVKQ